MADVSALALGELLLGSDSPGPTELWTDLLSQDPPLALWAACVAHRAGVVEPGSLGGLATWLSRHALEVFQWQSDRSDAHETDPGQAETWGERVAGAIRVASAMAPLLAQQPDATRQRAEMAGLFHDAVAWLAACEDGESGDAEKCLPSWLSPAGQEPAIAEALGNAAQLAREANRQTVASSETDSASDRDAIPPGPAPPGLSPDDLGTLHARAEDVRRRWLAEAGPAAGWLPKLSAKLARLAALENRFDETVETEKLEAMAEFAAGAGHEINNPLAVIAGRAQLFLREEADPERRRSLALVNAQAMRIYEMIADMRLFARPPQPERQQFDLIALVDRLAEEMAPLVAQQETQLRWEGAPRPLAIEADPVQLMVTLRAMVQNALEALGHRGHIELSVRPAGDHVEISIHDDGPGIAPEQRRHVFDPFYSARQAGRGLGIGLSKCWRIVTMHGGRIDVQSGAGQGATFTIRLPLQA